LLSTQIEDIVRISRSPEMASWRLNTDYDRPIPRRIAENAGVARHHFGMKKKYIALDRYMWPINVTLRRYFFRYVKETYGLNRITIYVEYILQKLYRKLLYRPIFSKLDGHDKYKIFLLNKKIDLYYLMCQWAIGILSNRASHFFSKEEPDGDPEG